MISTPQECKYQCYNSKHRCHSVYYDVLASLADEVGDITSEAIKYATAAASWCQLYQGVPLSKVTLDSVTLTEVLRLHLLSSGGRSGEMSSKWR